MPEKIKEHVHNNIEAVSYLFWGVCTTAVSWGSYSVLVKGMGLGIASANALSWLLAVLFAYFTNKLFVFHSNSWRGSDLIRELAMFFTARIASGIFEVVMVPFLVKIGMTQTILGVQGAAAKVLVSVAVVVLNYFFSKFLIFRNGKETK